MKSDELEKYLEEYIGRAKDGSGYGEDFMAQRAKGIILLFELKLHFKGLSSMLVLFREARGRIYDKMSCSIRQEDLIDELEAILIGDYPMPDFWTSNLEDFKSHINFKDDFDCLDRGLA